MPACKAGLLSGVPDLERKATKQLAAKLTENILDNEMAGELLSDSRVIKKLVVLLGGNDMIIMDHVVECLCLLADTDEHTRHSHRLAKAMVNAGSVEALKQVLILPLEGDIGFRFKVKEHALWTLTNLAAEDPKFRMRILQACGSAIMNLKYVIDPHTIQAPPKFCKTLGWLISNLSTPPSSLDDNKLFLKNLRDVLSPLKYLLMNEDEDCLMEVFKSIGCCSSNAHARVICDALEVPGCESLLRCLSHSNAKVSSSALDSVLRLSSCANSATVELFDASDPRFLFEGLATLLQGRRTPIPDLLNALRALHNVVVGIKKRALGACRAGIKHIYSYTCRIYTRISSRIYIHEFRNHARERIHIS